MFAWIRRFLGPPVFEDEDKTRIAGLLNTILLALLALTVVIGVSTLILRSNSMPMLVFVGAAITLLLVALSLMRRGRVQLSSIILSSVLWVIVSLVAIASGGVRTSAFSSYMSVILIAGLLIGVRAGLVFAGLSALAGLGMVYAETGGAFPPPLIPSTSASVWVSLTVTFIMAAVILHLATHSITSALESARRNERALAETNQGLQREIAERKQAEEALRESEKRYRLLAEAAHDMIFIISREGIVEYVNSFTIQQLGRPPGEILGRYTAELFPSAYAETEKLGLRRVFEAGQSLYIENPTLFAGRSVWLGTWLVPIKDEAGEVKSILGVSRDITERKQIEEEIKRFNTELEQRVVERTAQLEAANKELEAFAYSVSHDLRSPLRAIDGFARILVEDHEPSLDAEGRRVCAVIREQTARMGTLINDMLAFSRLGRAAMQPAAVDMTALARAVFDELTTAQSRERLELLLEPLPQALGDPVMLRQVWVNLLNNACKFSAKRERAVIRVSAKQGNGETVYSVRDNGAGFDMRYTDKLFSVFQRLHSEREFEGTGVGLAIVKRVILRHGGRVWAEGHVDQGATFYFALPRKQDQLTVPDLKTVDV